MTPVIFDVDRTLIRGDSQSLFLRYGFRHGIIDFGTFLRIIIWLFLFNFGLFKNPKNLMEYSYKFLVNNKKAELDPLFDKFTDKKIAGTFYADILRKINEAKKQNSIVILASNSINPIIERIAKITGADDFISTQLELKDGVYTGKIDGEINYGFEKLNRLTLLLQKYGFSISDATYYSDNGSDKPILESVKQPFAVNPDMRLRKILKKRNWPKLIIK